MLTPGEERKQGRENTVGVDVSACVFPVVQDKYIYLGKFLHSAKPNLRREVTKIFPRKEKHFKQQYPFTACG